MPLIPEDAFNFGIRVDDKRSILQIDFVDRTIFLMQRGAIRISMKFRKFKEFRIDGTKLHLSFIRERIVGVLDEEMDIHVLHKLLRIIEVIVHKDRRQNLSMDAALVACTTINPAVIPSQRLIRSGPLEKKGNAAVTRWEKRMVVVRENEVSYYKIDGDYPLNIIRVWKDNCQFHQVSESEFSISVHQPNVRSYFFRLPSASQMTSTKRSSGNSDRLPASVFDWQDALSRAALNIYRVSGADKSSHSSLTSSLKHNNSDLDASRRIVDKALSVFVKPNPMVHNNPHGDPSPAGGPQPKTPPQITPRFNKTTNGHDDGPIFGDSVPELKEGEEYDGCMPYSADYRFTQAVPPTQTLPRIKNNLPKPAKRTTVKKK